MHWNPKIKFKTWSNWPTLYLSFLLFLFFSLALNAQKNTPNTFVGTPLDIKGKQIPVEEIISPKLVPAGKPQKVKGYSNKTLAGNPIIIPINPKTLQTIPIGIPEKSQLQPEIVQISPTAAKQALTPRYRDIATQDISYLDVNQHLSSSYNHTVFEDSRGYIWIGTWGLGLQRYDSHAFISYTEQDGFMSNEVMAILEAKNGDLWFTTASGICRYDGINFYNFQLEALVNCLLEDSQGRIWIGREDGTFGYMEKELGHFQFTTLQKEGPPVYTITEDKQGLIWLGVGNKVYRYDGQKLTIFQEKDGLLNGSIQKIVIDQQGDLWAATTTGVFLYDGSNFAHFTEAQGLSHHHVWDAIVDKQGNLWFGTRRGGMIKYDGTYFTDYQLKEGLSNIEVTSLFQDSKEQIWMVTYGGGINIFNPNSFVNWTTAEGLSHNVVNHIIEDNQHNIWMATEGSGAIKYDGQDFYYFSKEQGFPSHEIACILPDKAGNIWFGTFDAGLIKYDGTYFSNYTERESFFSSTVQAILEDSKGQLWFATESGLIKYDGFTFTYFTPEQGFPGHGISDLIEDKIGDLWIASDAGVTKYDGSTFTHFTQQDGLISNATLTIYQDKEGTFWFGSTEGITKWDGTSIDIFTTKDGLSNNWIWAIQQDKKDNIWVGTEKGVNLIEWSRQNGISAMDDIKPNIIPYHQLDGIKGEDIRHHGACLDHKNQLWWGTGKGISILNLDNYYNSRQFGMPKVYLNSIAINGKRVNLSKDNSQFTDVIPFVHVPLDLQVPYANNHLTFNFIGIDEYSSNRVKYQYKLEGLEEKWSQITTSHQADYRSLPHGTYNFQLKAKNATGKWSQPITYSFRILAPWWATWWAYLSYTLWLFGIIYLIFYFLKKRWQLQNKLKQEQKEAQRLKELDSFKSKLFTNLTHEFRTPLTVILGMADQLAVGNWQTTVNKIEKTRLSKGLQLIHNNGNNLLQLINQLLDLSKLENKSFQLNLETQDIVSYIRYITESFQTFINSKNLALRFSTTVDNLVMDFDPEQIKQVMTNLIANAAKFTTSGGTIQVRLTHNNESWAFRNGQQPLNGQPSNYLTLTVIDTGVGIAQKDLPHIFDRFYQVDGSLTRQGEGAGIGLAHTQELVKLMGGSITAESELNKGTKFTIWLPIHISNQLKRIGNKQRENNQPTFTPYGFSTEADSLDNNHPTTTSSAPTLLIIEDNLDVVTYLKSCLSDHYQLDVAYNGRIGIEKAVAQIPDLIISDVMMPEKDGYEVCAYLKKEVRTSHIPFILLTAKADAASKIVGLRQGADAYLAKPFHKEELLVRLSSLMERQQRLLAYFSKSNPNGNVDLSVDEQLEATIQVEDIFVQKVQKIVATHYMEETFGLPQLCQKLQMSRSQLFRKMKALMGIPPSEFIRTYRLNQAKILLETTDLTVSEVTWKVGFKEIAHFSKTYQEAFGIPPSATNK